MKKVNFKFVLMALTFIAAIMLFDTAQMAAQTSTDAVEALNPIQGNFVNNDQAVQILETEIAEIIDQLKQLTPGTPVFNALNLKYEFYLLVKETIESGQTVPESILEALYFVMAPDNVLGVLATEQQALQLRDDAVELLGS
jgi:hypothetical protein